ncbi:MAG: AAA family ATPase [Lachnospiraceae bacterium]|nr:AAA family ATPase [Lachnospiraceae bacterium]
MVNFFFGRNGAGKSTVADILKNHPEDVEWENEDHDSREVLLYDQRFVTDHFRNREKDKKKIKGVFLVDKANAVKGEPQPIWAVIYSFVNLSILHSWVLSFSS